MPSLTTPAELKELLARHGFRFSKSLGQNFLIDGNVLNKIIEGAGVTKQDKILEIGPGVGTLTQALARKAGAVTAVEIDRTLLPILEETLKGLSNVRVLRGDILKLDLNELIREQFQGSPFKVVANLPYYITTPIIMRFLEEEHPFISITVMIQKEVAERMAAGPGTREYGSLSTAVQFFTCPRILARVPANAFLPPPKVDSVVISLERRKEPAVAVNSRADFFRVSRAAFCQRRKTLLNSLSASGLTDMDKSAWKKTLQELGIDPMRRGETLTLEELARLSNHIFH